MRSTTLIQRVRGAIVGIASAGVLATAMASPVAAASAVRVNANLGETCMYFRSDSATTVNLVWRASDGSLKVKDSIASDGFQFYCSNGPRVEVGDTMKVTAGGSSRTLVVPDVTVNVNRVTETLRGRAPANATVHIRCGQGPFPEFEPCVWKARASTGSDGKWSQHVPWDVEGGRFFSAYIMTSAGDKLGANGMAPYLTFSLGKARFTGAYRPNQVAHIVILDGTTLDTKATGEATGDPSVGLIDGVLTDSHGDPYQLQATDIVSSDIASDAEWTVPAIDASVNVSTDVISGHCSGPDPNAVAVYVKKNRYVGPAVGDVAADGSFSFNFNDFSLDNTNIRSGDKILVQCMRADADWVQITFFAG